MVAKIHVFEFSAVGPDLNRCQLKKDRFLNAIPTQKKQRQKC